ncbi:MAG: hypothetical protein A4E55_02017 [Pelotomaculum sp. PtaU1.Bin035]|nr:MAG: hypothetical protein A4E55_02017 [Pelotomaculum sp. PtaU1.Bin035]
MAMERIREIEKIIDNHHVGHSFFHRSRSQALFDILRIMEDGCRLSLIARMQKSCDPSEADYFIRVFLDAANIAVKWVYSLCSENSDDDISFEFSEETGFAALDLIRNYASPYCAICSAYISYSRKRLTAQIDEKTNTVTFLSTDSRKSMFCADIAEAFERRKISNSINLNSNVMAQLESGIYFENGRICYNYSSDVWDGFRQFAQAQWDYTETLPETWTFDSFSLKDYKETWITITTLCYIHSFACMKSNAPGMAVEDAVILIDEVQFVESIANLSGVSQETILKIIQYITYNNAIKNNDIMYQPVFKFKNKLAITPYLFMSSRPERNLISLISKMSDAQYSILTNTLEVLMQDDIDRQLGDLKGIIKVRNIHLAPTLPDVDYGIYDPRTNSALICELKWLNESDSTQEVFAREDDIEHGCDQVKKIMASAIANVPAFIEKVFNVQSEYIDLFYCVISKNSIRSVSDDVPVISLNKFIEVLKKSDINNGFHAIRNRDYYDPIPENSQMDSEAVSYAGYTFNIPALITDLT